jgi:hypothetical protein
MDAFPPVRVILGGTEPPFRRPQGWGEREPFYPGKQKRHTVKNQVVCRPDGRIGAVRPTVPGSAHDLTMRRGRGLPAQVGADAGARADTADLGMQDDRPDRPVVVPTKARRGRPLTEDQKAANRVISRYRVVIEHVMAQLSRPQVLKHVFRSAVARHTQVIRVVATLVNRRIQAGPRKTYLRRDLSRTGKGAEAHHRLFQNHPTSSGRASTSGRSPA